MKAHNVMHIRPVKTCYVKMSVVNNKIKDDWDKGSFAEREEKIKEIIQKHNESSKDKEDWEIKVLTMK